MICENTWHAAIVALPPSPFIATDFQHIGLRIQEREEVFVGNSPTRKDELGT